MDDFTSACGEGESALHHIGLYNPTIRNIINLLRYTDILRSK